ncbi:amidohydrolase [Oscillibacter sp.]|uniref:amidohydrolase n=1 Tax=Oscillibacter sp. TaxID=1945593 RepID=UPI0033924D46
MELDALKQQAFAAEDAASAEAEAVSAFLYAHPELGDQEIRSSRYLADMAKSLGYQVQMPYAGVPTAFRAEFGDDDGPSVAFLAEYDALPGYGDKSPDGSGNGHACGHNWIAASTYAAAAALKSVKSQFHGKIIWIGTPAEETCGRKINMAQAGAFDGVDAVFQFHLAGAPGCCLENYALACTDLTYTFTGHASHASFNPESGVNALDACNLAFAGVNALRQHLPSDTRVHGIIVHGGTACNVVPDHCVMQYFVRSRSKDLLEKIIEKVNNCAKGAALMTGCQLVVERAPNTFYDMKNCIPLVEKMQANLQRLGITDFRQDDLYHAGSTDIGNVSYHAPTCYGVLSTSAISNANPHDAAYLDVVDSSYAHKLLHTAAKAMAATALDVLCDADLRTRLT